MGNKGRRVRAHSDLEASCLGANIVGASNASARGLWTGGEPGGVRKRARNPLRRWAALALGACALLLAGAAAAQDYRAEARYGSAELAAGFSPDPFAIDVRAGGLSEAAHLGETCKGYISNEKPDFEIMYSPGDYKLGIFVLGGEADTT